MLEILFDVVVEDLRHCQHTIAIVSLKPLESVDLRLSHRRGKADVELPVSAIQGALPCSLRNSQESFKR